VTDSAIEHIGRRIKWYTSIAMFGTLCAARLIGVTP
jgi:hypothetical protein